MNTSGDPNLNIPGNDFNPGLLPAPISGTGSMTQIN